MFEKLVSESYIKKNEWDFIDGHDVYIKPDLFWISFKAVEVCV